jgi:hypothetical protein
VVAFLHRGLRFGEQIGGGHRAAGGLQQRLDEAFDLGFGLRALEDVGDLALPERGDRGDRLHRQAELGELADEGCWLASMSILTSLMRPPAALTTFSSVGVRVLQGPHQVAQKSTRTGIFCEASMTSVMKVFWSPSTIMFAGAVAAAEEAWPMMWSIERVPGRLSRSRC